MYRKTSEHTPRLKLLVGERDHIQGSQDAKVTLLKYGDYQCPYCGEAYGIVKRVQEKFGSDLRFVFRNFPLTEVHPRAEFGAEIAESASDQGKFWEMHDYLYEHQSYLSNEEFFLQYAGSKLGMDAQRIRDEVATHAHLPRIREDFMSGVRSGVNGTPTFFINDFRHNGDYQFETLVGAIEAALAGNQKKEKIVKALKPRVTKKTKKK
ncbi:MAG TPA: thioredoxin domain-containing protein [Nitrososphaerales archaeon]|nr:thioredoxin domain-containing protein [Nitrososphaerales archaeon]